MAGVLVCCLTKHANQLTLCASIQETTVPSCPNQRTTAYNLALMIALSDDGGSTVIFKIRNP
jgi:hypothetical protein